jgi:uncharacterized protein
VTRLLAALLVLAAASCHSSSPVDHSIAHTPAGDFELSGRVVDQAQVLPATVERQLAADSATREKETKDQLVVVTIPTLRNAAMVAVGLALGRGWGIGQRGLDNGVLLLVAPNERKVRIEVGYGLEALLRDEVAGKIVRDMLPLFRANKPADAISLGEKEIIAVLKSDKRRPQYFRKAA